MELRQLRYFLTLAEHLNFHQAAAALHITQPPLSIAIKKLETELGVSLFIRNQKEVKLSSEGEKIMAYAQKILNLEQHIIQTAKEINQGLVGSLKIGIVGSTTQQLFQHIMSQFRQSYPKISLHFSEKTSTEIIKAVNQGDLDLGLIRTPIFDYGDIQLQILEQDRFVLATAEHFKLPQKNLKLSDLKEEEFIAYSNTDAKGLAFAMSSACQEAGFNPKVSQVAIQIQTVLSLVEGGFGVALVPSIMKNMHNQKINFYDLEDESNKFRIGYGLVYKTQTESRSIQIFREILHKSRLDFQTPK